MSLHLFEKFVKDEGLGYFDELFNDLYTCATEDFDREVRANVFFVAFGKEYYVSIEEFFPARSRICRRNLVLVCWKLDQ